ncbi:hypothetical protein A3D08_02915 [Candidatus Roizmanbacteria bacterium RIFCSPHIGHO2_02_FULL_43_11]|uniref:Peptidase S8/S53 domain-containing protein n=1 Tax=Candidatus Roizmanbacteria bacterium RIFCSPHIGHO2_02_FULL_43_11 TaxID=1802043 RepID=A0A1F7HFF3_9BACT|nr:MAG: hypothetical protein A3D08_02915 [Candidatus Roizmanbacteria bacterium RIFCSPHIGHO2_02_FULL_43_11]
MGLREAVSHLAESEYRGHHKPQARYGIYAARVLLGLLWLVSSSPSTPAFSVPKRSPQETSSEYQLRPDQVTTSDGRTVVMACYDKEPHKLAAQDAAEITALDLTMEHVPCQRLAVTEEGFRALKNDPNITALAQEVEVQPTGVVSSVTSQESSPDLLLENTRARVAHGWGIRGRGTHIGLIGYGVNEKTHLLNLQRALDPVGVCLGTTINDSIQSGCEGKQSRVKGLYAGTVVDDDTGSRHHEHALAQVITYLAPEARITSIALNTIETTEYGRRALAYLGEIVRGINEAIDMGVDFINVSFNTVPDPDNPYMTETQLREFFPPLNEAVDRANQAGIAVVFSAGNYPLSAYPAGLRGVVSVSTISEGGFVPLYAPADPRVTFAVRGENVPVQRAWDYAGDEDWTTLEGTSGSAAEGDGLLALGLSGLARYGWTQSAIVSAFTSRGARVPKSGTVNTVSEAHMGVLFSDPQVRRDLGLTMLSLPWLSTNVTLTP